MLDENKTGSVTCLSQIEINTISCSFGAATSHVAKLHDYVLKYTNNQDVLKKVPLFFYFPYFFLHLNALCGFALIEACGQQEYGLYGEEHRKRLGSLPESKVNWMFHWAFGLFFIANDCFVAKSCGCFCGFGRWAQHWWSAIAWVQVHGNKERFARSTVHICRDPSKRRNGRTQKVDCVSRASFPKWPIKSLYFNYA